MKKFWAGLAAGVALGVLGYKVATSDEARNAINKCEDAIIKALDRAIEATS